MPRLSRLSFTALTLSLLLASCASVDSGEVLEQTDNDAVIRAESPTKEEAIQKIQASANDLFKAYAIERGECKQSEVGHGDHSHMNWSCAALVKKATKTVAVDPSVFKEVANNN